MQVIEGLLVKEAKNGEWSDENYIAILGYKKYKLKVKRYVAVTDWP